MALLLDSLRAAGAHEQTATLADRAATHAPLNDPDSVALLLDSLRAAGAHEQTATLADRAATHALDHLGLLWLACWASCDRQERTTRPPP